MVPIRRCERDQDGGVEKTEERRVVAVDDGQDGDVQCGRGRPASAGVRQTLAGQRETGAAGGLEPVHDHEGEVLHVRGGLRDGLSGQVAAVVDQQGRLDQLLGDLLLVRGERPCLRRG